MTTATLPRYAEYAPSACDPAGAFLDDRQDWIVAPCGRNRDTQDDPVTASNWDAQLALLEEAGAEYEIHSFAHWACGWFEIVIVSPEHASTAEDIANRLEDYPLLDEDAHSSLECEARERDWDEYGRSDFIRACQRTLQGEGDDTPAHEYLGRNPPAFCWEWGTPVEVCSCGNCVPTMTDVVARLEDWLADSANIPAIDELARECEREVYCEGSGTVFSHDTPSLEQLIDAAGL